MIVFIDTLFTPLGATDHTALSLIYTLYSSPLYTHWSYPGNGFIIVSLSLQITHEVFHGLIPLLPLFCSCQFRRLDSIQFLFSQTHIPAGWRLETRLYSNDLICPFRTSRHGPRRKHTLSTVGKAWYSIVAWVFVCLPSRCLARTVYSDFTIPVFGRLVTIYRGQLHASTVLLPGKEATGPKAYFV
jgi:hypothetical protein